LAAGTIIAGSGVIANGAITNALIGNLAVDTANIAAGAIVEAKIGDGQITNAKIGNFIQSSNYAAGSAGWKIHKDGTAEFGAAVIRGTFSADQIAANSITSGKIAANSITSDKISVTSLSAVSANMGGLNTGYINLSGNGTGDGYIRSYNKSWEDNNSGWILNRNGTTGDTFIKFTAGNSTFKMSSWQDNVIEWKDTSGNEKLYIDASGNARFSGNLTANAVNAVNTINIAGNAVSASGFNTTTWLSGTAIYAGGEAGADWVGINYPAGDKRTMLMATVQANVPSGATNVGVRFEYSTNPQSGNWTEISRRLNSSIGGFTTTHVFTTSIDWGFNGSTTFRTVVYNEGASNYYYPMYVSLFVLATFR
jgi:hypothetical protein